MSSVVDAGRGGKAGVRTMSTPRAIALRTPALAWIVLAALVLATGGLLLHETRGTTLWFDEWTWLLHRRGDSASSFLASHNGHLSLIPVAVYKLLFATVGIRHSAPYRALMIAAHLGCCVLLFVYARRRVGVLLAMVATTLILLFGPGWENLLWAFQITWLTSLGAGIGALLALDRRDRAGDVLACVLLAVALASSGIGVAIMLGLIIEVGLGRRDRPREWWVVGVPLLLYAGWALFYQHTTIVRHAFVAAPSFVATGLASTFSALAGLGGSTGLDWPGSLMTWGPALLVVALGAGAWRVARLRRLEPRVASLTAIVLSFWLLTALTRAVFANPYSSRYLYVSALFVVLLAVELARGTTPGWRVQGLIGILALGAIVSNLGALRDAGRNFRDEAMATRADLGALEIGRPAMPAGYVAQGMPGYPFVVVPAAAYFAATRAVGSPAASPAQIEADPESVREVVDAELIRIHRIGLLAPVPAVRAGVRPVPDSATGGVAQARGACVSFVPGAFTPARSSAGLAVTVPGRGLVVESSGAPATIGVRRFADVFQSVGTLNPGSPAELLITPDRSPKPWHVQLTGPGHAVVCGLR